MRYSGIQPQYFPRLHYFARILNSDIYMIRDECQFVLKHKYPDGQTKPSYQAHTPIKIFTGIYHLTVPTQHSYKKTLSETIIAYNQNWIDNHLKTIEFAYKKAPFFPTIFPEIEILLKQNHKILSNLSQATILWGILRLLGENNVSIDKLTTKFVMQKLQQQKNFRLKKILQSTHVNAFSPNDNLTANQKIIALCKAVGATEDYCGGTSISAYINHNIFKENNIKVIVQDWKCQEYNQFFTKQGFIKDLSIIDLLMNNNTEESIKIING